MAQRLDDVTGLPVDRPLSSSEREARMRKTVSTLNAVIVQSNAHVAAIRDLRNRIEELEHRLNALAATVHTPSWLARVRRRVGL